MAFKSNAIHLCKFCGEKTTGKLCKHCKTVAGRKQQVEEQLKIDRQNEKLGYKIPSKIFGYSRDLIIKKLKED